MTESVIRLTNFFIPDSCTAKKLACEHKSNSGCYVFVPAHSPAYVWQQ